MRIRPFTVAGPFPRPSFRVVLSVAILLAFAAMGSAASAQETRSNVGAMLTDNPDPVRVGEKLIYTAITDNKGPDTVVSTGVPRGTKFVSSKLVVGSSERACPPDTDGAVDCRIGKLGVNEEATLTLVVRPLHPGRLFNVAYADADNNQAVGDRPVISTAVLPPEECTVVGTKDDDRLIGTSGKDVICAFSGDDVLLGKEDRDVLYGGVGNDELVGGYGGDKLYGGSGSDTIRARDGIRGNDVAHGGKGKDSISADRGDRVRD